MPSSDALETPRRRVPKQARAQERVERILAAARAELEQRAPAEIRTDDIAKRAGVPVGSIYQYFDGKDGLLAAVAEMVIGEADAAVAAELASCLEIPWRDAVDRVADATFGFYDESRSYRRLVRTIRHTAAFAEITAISNDRVAEWIAMHPAFARAGIPRAEALDLCRVVTTIGNALQDRALVDEELDASRWGDHLRTVVKAFLAQHLP